MQDKNASDKSPINQLGKYRIRGLISRGSMGMVFHGHDPLLDRDVAIKVMVGASVFDETLRKRFEHEARAVARLHHPNIITIHDLGYDQHGSPYIAMELLEGADLDQLIDADPPTLGRRLEIIAQVCRGLAHAHRNGIIHRDIKPANVFVAKDGSVKIMDFGVARFTQTAQTQSGLVVGTAGYMSPEQLRAKRVDGRSDIFSLGVVLFEFLTNQALFSGDAIEAVFFQTLNKRTPVLAMPDGTEIPALQEILNRALAKDPDGRYWGADEMEEAIQAVLESHADVVREKAFFEVRDAEPDDVERSSKETERSKETPDGGPVVTSPAGQTKDNEEAATSRRPIPSVTRKAKRPGSPRTTIRRRSRPRWPLVVGVAALVLITLGGTTLWMLRRTGTVPIGATAASPEVSPSVELREADDRDAVVTSDVGQGQLPGTPAPSGQQESLESETTSTPSPREEAALCAADAALALSRGRLEEAKSLIAQGESLDPQSPRWEPLRQQLRAQEVDVQRRSQATHLIAKARRLLEAGSFQEAIDTYKTALEYDSRNQNARSELERAIELERQIEAVVERPEAEPRHFVESETEFVPAGSERNKVMGFEIEERFNVKGTADPLLPAQVLIEFEPKDARPGEPYVLQVSVFNEGYRTIAFQSLELVSRYGHKITGKGHQIAVRVPQIGPQAKVVLHEVSGTWSESRNHGEIEAIVTLGDGGKLIKSISW